MSITPESPENSGIATHRMFLRVQSTFQRHARLLKFLAVGVLNTAFGYGIFAFLIWYGLHYSLAAAISTVLGVLFNFKTTGALVFRSHENSKIIRFVLAYMVVYCANVAALAVLVHLGVDTYLAGLILILPLALLAYFLNSQFVFK
jgi:putative flippase GtrA